MKTLFSCICLLTLTGCFCFMDHPPPLPKPDFPKPPELLLRKPPELKKLEEVSVPQSTQTEQQP